MSKQTKTWLIIASSLVLFGCIMFGGVMSMLQWDFHKLSTIQYETNHHTIHEDYTNILILTDTADVALIPSENSETTVVCREQQNAKHSVAVKDGTLVIELTETRKWYEHIGITFTAPNITVSIPQGKYGALSVKSTTGDIDVKTIFAQTVDLSVSTGNVNISNISCEGHLNITVTTGKTNITDSSCQTLISNGSTGSISLKNVVAAEKFSIERNTGSIKFDSCDAAELFIETDTGNVTGTLLSDKVFLTQTDTGSIKVPQTTDGGKCEIRTNTGNIKVEIR